MQRLLDMDGNGIAFIRTPIPTKEMWDGVQSAHIKTLSCCFVIESPSKRANVPILFRDMMKEVMESGPVTMPLYLRIAAWHDDQLRSGSGTRLDIGEIMTELVPRQASLHKLDPSGELTVPSVRTHLEPLVHKYEKLILHDKVEAGMTLKDALKIYNYFHLLRRAPSWGDICVSCNCRVCFANCVCQDSLLFVSLFKPDVRVPHAWIGATPSLRKKCRSIKSSAGRKRLRLIAERQCNEKVINSKVTYLQGSGQSRHRHLTFLTLPRFYPHLLRPSLTMMTS
jgi:hypothetical protein